MPKHAATGSPKPKIQPHDTRILVNRAPSPKWIRDWRDKIRVSHLIGRLQTFALDDPENPTGPRMTRTQATVALSLLRKVLPDMQSVEISGNSERPLVVQVMRFSDGLVIDADHNPIGAPPVLPPVLDVGEDDVSAPHSAERRTNPDVSDVGNGPVPYSVPYSDALPPSIETNPRLIEDEPPKRKTGSRRKQNQRGRHKPAADPAG